MVQTGWSLCGSATGSSGVYAVTYVAFDVLTILIGSSKREGFVQSKRWKLPSQLSPPEFRWTGCGVDAEKHDPSGGDF